MSDKEERKKHETLVQLHIREKLMEYYKNTSGNQMTRANGIYTADLNVPTRYQYERRIRDMRRPQMFYIADTSFAEMWKNPNEFIIKVDPDRSPEMHKLVGFLTKFFSTYLPAVKVKIDPAQTGKVDDKGLMASINVRLRDTDSHEGINYDGNLYYAFGESSDGIEEAMNIVRPRVSRIRRMSIDEIMGLQTADEPSVTISTSLEWAGVNTVSIPLPPAPEFDVESPSFDENHPF